MPNFQTMMRIAKQGNLPEPFSARTPPPIGRVHANRENLIRRSREHYGTPRVMVEDRIGRWMKRN